MSLEIAGVRLAAEIGLASILADSEDGLSIDEIAGKTGVDGSKLGTFLDILKVFCILKPSQSVSSGFWSPKGGSANPNKDFSRITVSVT